MKAKLFINCLCLLVAVSLTSSCAGNAHSDTETTTAAGASVEVSGGESVQSVAATEMPKAPEIQEASRGNYTPTGGETVVALKGGSTDISGGGASFSEGELLLSKAGTYILHGSLDGHVTVDTSDNSKITLVLDGVSVSSPDSPAIFVKSLPKKLVIYTTEGSVNILSDGEDYVVPDEEQTDGDIYPNACIYSCEDLTLDGSGSLYVYGNADKGINTKDDLEILGGTVVVRSEGVGIRGNDSITAEGGEVYVSSGADGVKSANTDADKGNIALCGTSFYIQCAGDGISASSRLDVSEGKIIIQTRDRESATDTAAITDAGDVQFEDLRGMGGMPPGGMGGGMMGGMPDEEVSDKSAVSAKGLKAVSSLNIVGGQISIDSADDGIHCDNTASIDGGEIYISAADDGIHADNYLTLNSGIIEIADSFEGIEAHVITINGGTLRITADNDGTNANGGTSMGGGWGYSDGESDNDITPALYINGGYIVMRSEGDGLDSNGCVYMTGGTVIVYGPTSGGNGAIDYGDGRTDTFEISGGTLLAVGSSGMAQTATGNGQGVIFGNMNSYLPPQTYIGILDSSGGLLAAFKLPKAISSVVFSSPEVIVGDTYTVVYGGEYDGDSTDGILSGGTYKNYSTLGSSIAS